MGRPLLAPLAVIGLMTALLAGCQSEPQPNEPEASATTSDTDLQPPELPEAATAETPEGAAAFVDYYLAVLNYARRTGYTDVLDSLSAASCDSCTTFITTVDDTYGSGGGFTGTDWSLGEASVRQLTTVWSVTGVVRTTPGSQIPSAGEDPRESEETATQIEFQAAYEAGTWSMMSFSAAA